MLTEGRNPVILIIVAVRIPHTREHRGVAQFGRALRSGRRGRGFKSRHLDHLKQLMIASAVFLFSGKLTPSAFEKQTGCCVIALSQRFSAWTIRRSSFFRLHI